MTTFEQLLGLIRRRRRLVDDGAPRDGLGDGMRSDHGVHVGVLVLLLGAVADERTGPRSRPVRTASISRAKSRSLERKAQWSTP
ncbi:hypothetical protein [Burkholderia gladioli]|uniref:hypothetical protein n=1 Tax=Burkholderia gladioli TaxID=28095 RepID=UPI001C5E05AF|nr:hypothetical protein [Burkholderia gladioli]MBW5287208.1 hypothetical protein [Burkholderia gladioli]